MSVGGSLPREMGEPYRKGRAQRQVNEEGFGREGARRRGRTYDRWDPYYGDTG